MNLTIDTGAEEATIFIFTYNLNRLAHLVTFFAPWASQLDDLLALQ